MTQWYEDLFESYGEAYDNEIFTKGTIGECDFIEKELKYDKSLRILDVGCGTGRHAIELTRRGYSVVGIDLSERQLEIAKKKAKISGLNIPFIKMDARNITYKECFDVAIMICEGAFPLMETDEMNYDILRNVTNALTKPAKFIFTTLNGLFPIFNSITSFHETDNVEDGAKYNSTNFDIMTFRDYNITTFIDKNGKEIKLKCSERYYLPSEITWLLKSLGYNIIDIYGAKLGAFSKEDKLTKDDYEMLVIAEIK